MIKASSREVVGEEGSKASLSCYLKGGSPTPAVSWSRAHGKRWPGGGPPPEGPTITLGKEGLSSFCRAQTYPSLGKGVMMSLKNMLLTHMEYKCACPLNLKNHFALLSFM